MKTATITILGEPIKLKYYIHVPNYVEWYLEDDITDISHPYTSLLEVVLRTHYSALIENTLKDLDHYNDLAVSAASQDDIPF